MTAPRCLLSSVVIFMLVCLNMDSACSSAFFLITNQDVLILGGNQILDLVSIVRPTIS